MKNFKKGFITTHPFMGGSGCLFWIVLFLSVGSGFLGILEGYWRNNFQLDAGLAAAGIYHLAGIAFNRLNIDCWLAGCLPVYPFSISTQIHSARFDHPAVYSSDGGCGSGHQFAVRSTRMVQPGMDVSHRDQIFPPSTLLIPWARFYWRMFFTIPR